MNPTISAIQQALQLQRHPEVLFDLQQSPLPEGMAILIRLASDEGSFRDAMAQSSDVDASLLQQAAAAYLRSICLFPGSQGLRVLALNDARDMRLAKDHHRLLIKWLHPDRNPHNQILAERVNQAWSQLKAKRPAVPAASAPADPWSSQDRRVPPKSRFAWFLGGLAGLSGVLLLLSLLPEQEVYVSGINADTALGATEPDLAAEDNTTLAALRHLAWAEPAGSVSKQEAPSKPVPARKADMEKPLSVSAFSDPGSNSSKAKAAPIAITQMSIKPVAGPVPVMDNPATKPVPTAASIGPKSVDAMQRAETPRDQGVAMADAQALLPLFISRYRQGDIESFMALFSRDARNNRGDREAIAEDYGRLFDGSQRRELEVSQPQWHLNDGDIILQARYRSKVRPEGAMLAVINKGRIELVFVDDGSDVRIQRILIGE